VFDGGNDDVGDITVGRDIGHVPAEPACESCDEIGSAENASHDLSFTLAAIVSLGLDGSSDLEFGKTAGGRDILNVDPCAGLELGGEDLENLEVGWFDGVGVKVVPRAEFDDVAERGVPVFPELPLAVGHHVLRGRERKGRPLLLSHSTKDDRRSDVETD
jgi:hypothetical protein